MSGEVSHCPPLPTLIIILPIRLTHLGLPDAPTTPPLFLSPLSSSLILSPFVQNYLRWWWCHCGRGPVSCFLSLCGNVCETKLQTQLGRASERVCRSIRRTCRPEQSCGGKFVLVCFVFVVLVQFEVVSLGEKKKKGVYLLDYKHLHESRWPQRSYCEETMQPSSGSHDHDNCVQTQLCGEFADRKKNPSEDVRTVLLKLFQTFL